MQTWAEEVGSLREFVDFLYFKKGKLTLRQLQDCREVISEIDLYMQQLQKKRILPFNRKAAIREIGQLQNIFESFKYGLLAS